MDDQRRWWAEIGIQEEFEAWLDQLNKELALEDEERISATRDVEITNFSKENDKCPTLTKW